MVSERITAAADKYPAGNHLVQAELNKNHITENMLKNLIFKTILVYS